MTFQMYKALLQSKRLRLSAILTADSLSSNKSLAFSYQICIQNLSCYEQIHRDETPDLS